MELYNFFIIAILELYITFFVVHKHRYSNFKILLTLIGITITLTTLIFPIYPADNILSRVVFSALYAAQTALIGQDFELINVINMDNTMNTIYVIFIYCLFIILPLTTASALLTLFGNKISKLRLIFGSKKDVLVFSEINEKTVTIANLQYQKGKNLIVFIDNTEKYSIYKQQVKKIKAIILKTNLKQLKLANKNITYYIYSTDEEENLNTALVLIKNNDKTKNVNMYVLNNTASAEVILDSADKKGVKLELINEANRMIYQHLSQVPLYKNSINNTISILIVGCGNIGTEFLKAVTWCGQLINYKLNINIIDIHANSIKEKINITCPELLENYNYNFIEADIYSNRAIEELNNLKSQNINYILVSLKDENKNLDVAIFLRKYFLSQDNINYSRMPVISLWICNDDKREQIDSLKHDKIINSYNLTPFGSTIKMYKDNSIINSDIEELAKQVHSVYNPADAKNKLEKFYMLEYNKKSSRAIAVHLKYKLYSVLKYNYKGNLEEDLNNNLNKVLNAYEKMANEEVLQALIENEHDRWSAYLRTNGFRTVSTKDVLKYAPNTKNSKHFLAGLHPALVPYSEIPKIEKELNESFILYDTEIIKSIGKILKKEIYKEKNK